MSVFAPIPIGQRIPDSLHAVSCSLPTLASVRGYEEKDPAITRQLTSGYPRFVVHPLLQQLAARVGEEYGLSGKTVWLTSSARIADLLARRLGPGVASVIREEEGAGLHGVVHDTTPEHDAAAKLFLQNIGGFMSSRAAEDELVRRGLLPSAAPEPSFEGNSVAEVERQLLPAFPGATPADIVFANSGMNAVYAAFRSISEIQGSRGRTVWIQLGWLYLDTIAILRRLTTSPFDYVHLRDVFDLGPLERLLEKRGSKVAGIVAEVPTNPLIQTPDIPALAALARRHGVHLVLDPSVNSPFAVNLLPYADVVVTSLTKYTASEGDVIAGAAVVNAASPDADALRKGITRWIEPVYPRDLARLAAQIGQTSEVLARIQRSVPEVVAFLSGHPAVREVLWALHPASRENYLKVARSPESVGSMISFSLKGPIDAFYDRLDLPKGPSFGMTRTLICPFLYLAHYDMVTKPEGRSELQANGIDPELLRLSVGTEPTEDIIGALRTALD
jgi:cystathionine gamma-synthase